jgi:hypothetical protein
VLHFVPTDIARRSVAAFADAMAPGSYLIISVGFDGSPAPDGDFADTSNAQAGPVIYRQSRDGINALFTGLEVIPPGVVSRLPAGLSGLLIAASGKIPSRRAMLGSPPGVVARRGAVRAPPRAQTTAREAADHE